MGEELVGKCGWKVCGSRCFNQELNSGPLGWVIKIKKDCVEYMAKYHILDKATVEEIVPSWN